MLVLRKHTRPHNVHLTFLSSVLFALHVCLGLNHRFCVALCAMLRGF